VSITAELSRPVEHPTSVRHLVLAALLAITSINYAQRNAIGPAAPVIRQELGLSLEQIGLLMSAFFLAYTIMQVPAGTLAQRIGAKWALVLISAGWSLAIAGCAVAGNFIELYVARLALGALQAGIFSCATLILAVWYPPSQRGLATALLNSFMLIGGAAGAMLTGVLLVPLGWRGVFAAYAVPGLLWAGWFAWWFRSRPQDHPGVNHTELLIIQGMPLPDNLTPGPAAPRCEADWAKQVVAHRDAVRAALPAAAAKQMPVPNVERRTSVLAAILSVSLLLICVQQFFRAGASRLFDNWLPTYFVEERGANVNQAALLSSMPQWGGVVGGLVGGMLSDYVLRRTGSRRAGRKGVALGSLLVSFVCYLIAYSLANVTAAAAMLSAGAFIFSFSSPCAYALTIDIGGRYLAIVFSIMNMAGNLGAFTFIQVIPFLVRLGGWPLALGVFAGMNLAAALCWILLDPEIIIGEVPRRPTETSS
jgi:MFS family permease